MKVLKSPAERGSKKDHEDFFEAIASHVAISWEGRKDIAQLLKKAAEPKLEEPEEISEVDEKSKLKLHP